MSTKIANNLKINITVDSFSKDEEKGIITCACYTPGTGEEYDTVVSIREFKDSVSVNNQVTTCNYGDTDDCPVVSVDQWFDNLSDSELEDELSDYINKKEGRKSFIYFQDFPDVPASINKIVHPLKDVA